MDLVRRNSLSLRSPPAGSIAAEILETTATPQLNQVRSGLSELKDMTAKLSEYESCMSSSDGDDPDCVDSVKDNTYEVFTSMNERKRDWKKKRKSSRSPTKDSFVKTEVKKLNLEKSPKNTTPK